MLEQLIGHDAVLSRSWQLLLDECRQDGISISGITVAGDNGAFVHLQDATPVIAHKLPEGFAFPVHFVVYGENGQSVSMTVEEPE